MLSNLIKDDLYKKILIEPAQQDVNHLYIVSGYASSAMAFHHAETLKTINKNIYVHLIIGMIGKDGLELANHRAFQKLVNKDLTDRFECRYLINRPAVHSKVYAWTNGFNPVTGFTGSANYSQQAFIGNRQREIITNCNSNDAYDYYHALIKDSICCTHSDAEKIIQCKSNYSKGKKLSTPDTVSNEIKSIYTGLEHAKASLISSIDTVYSLNWGHRKNGTKRNLNQAYIQLPPNVYKSEFFPFNTIHFSVLTDDGETLICTRAQKNEPNGNAIETPYNNSLLGAYFRRRLGLKDDVYVEKKDLLNYGRTDVDFYKIDDENYYMDFSV